MKLTHLCYTAWKIGFTQIYSVQNMVQKSANYGEIEGKYGKYLICFLVYMGL